MSKLNVNWFNEIFNNGENILEIYFQLCQVLNKEILHNDKEEKVINANTYCVSD